MTRDLVVTRWGVRFGGRQIPAAIGRGGFARDKREGDGATPVGVHRLVGLLYRPDRIPRAALPRWAVPIRPGDLWSDDPRDPDYNQLVAAPHGFSHEAMRRADPLYDLVLVTDWNWEAPEPGRGSAIFLHVWRRPRYPTAGCVAFARRDLMWIAARLTPESRVIVRG